jgi:anti-anti-sigma factor
MASPSWEALTFRREERPEGIVLFPSGEVDLASAPALWAHLRAILEDGLHVIVSLRGVTYIDSTGIKTLLDIHRMFVERGQRFALSEPAPVVRKVMEIAGLERAIPVHASLEAALESFRPSVPPPPLPAEPPGRPVS